MINRDGKEEIHGYYWKNEWDTLMVLIFVIWYSQIFDFDSLEFLFDECFGLSKKLPKWDFDWRL